MNVTSGERRRLADLLAQRFPDWSQRERLVSQADMPAIQVAGDPKGAWQLIVEQAVEMGKLGRLLEVAAKAKPDDEDLHTEAQAMLRGEARANAPPSQVPLYLAATGAVVLGIAVVGVAIKLVFFAPAPPPPPPPAPVEIAPVPAPPPPKKRRAHPTDAAAAPADGTNPAAEAPAEGTPEEAPPAPAEAPVDVLTTPDRPQGALESACASAPRTDGRVGFIYAGADEPEVVKGVWHTGRSGNVRVDYPHRENGFDSQAKVVCSVPAGSAIEVANLPIEVTGGAWWVPVKDVHLP